MLPCVITEYLEDGLHGLFIDRVDVFSPSFLNEYEAASDEGLKIMGDHALVLVQGLRDPRYVSGTISQEFKNGQPSWIGQCRKEKVTRLAHPLLQWIPPIPVSND